MYYNTQNTEPYVEPAISENPFNFSINFLMRVLYVSIFIWQKVAASEHEAGCTYRICPIYNCQMPENFLPYFHRQAPIHKHTEYTHVIVFTKSRLCIGFARIMQNVPLAVNRQPFISYTTLQAIQLI